MKSHHSKLIVGFILGLALTRAGGQTNSSCAPILSVNSLSSGSFTFNIGAGPTGKRHVFSTSDLNTPLWNWDYRGEITLSGSGQTFTDNTISNTMYRFYKVSTTNGDCCTK